MKPKSFLIGTALIIFASMLVSSCSSQKPSLKMRPVELWVGGDDGLTQRLADAVEEAMKASPDFAMSSGKKSGSLVVTIPTNVKWKDIGKRTQVFYAVEFSSIPNQIIGTSTGSCWDDELLKCAEQIMVETKKAASNMR